jgi:hypothetical protein
MDADFERKLKTTQVERSIFKATFEDPNGLQVLAWIGNECGAWAQDPAVVKPELVAFWNRLLGKIGTIHEMNLITLARAAIIASNDADLAAARKYETETKEE